MTEPQYYLIRKDELNAAYVAPIPQNVYNAVLDRPHSSAAGEAEKVLEDLVNRDDVLHAPNEICIPFKKLAELQAQQKGEQG